jgi:hypothetical protein
MGLEVKFPSRKTYYTGEAVFEHLVGPKPQKESVLGVCPECLQACWYTWVERNDPDEGLREVAILAGHSDKLCFMRCKGSGKEPLPLDPPTNTYY